MNDRLPDNFAEDWGALKTDIGYIKKKLDKVEPADIKHLKQDVKAIKAIGGTIFTGLVVGLGWAWRRILNGGS